MAPNFRRIILIIGSAWFLGCVSLAASAEEFTNAVAAYLQYYVHAQVPQGCLVVGIVDEHGSSVISCGDLDNGTQRQADGDTLFAIQSATYTFFCLLLQDAVDRGELQPDDPVQKYLPASVKMPTFHGKQITLRQLAKETSGLHPDIEGALDPQRAEAPFEGFTHEKFFALLTNCQLTAAPGTTHMHPSVDREVINQVIAAKAGTNFESVLTARLLGPLGMNDTRLVLSPGQEPRVAFDHSQRGIAMPRWHLDDYPSLAGLYSSANDLIKFLSAAGITSSRLRPLWDKTFTNLSYSPPRDGRLHTGGGWGLNGSYIGFDKARRRGVVILASSYEPRSSLGDLLLDSEWKSDQRPNPVRISNELYPAYAGQYRRSPDFALGWFVLRHYALERPRPATVAPAALCLVILAVLFWRARKRWRVLGWVMLAGAVLVPLLPVAAAHIFCAGWQPGIGIRSEGGRLFAESTGRDLCPIEDWARAQTWSRKVYPVDILFPQVATELLPESETRFFERVSGVPIIFSRDDRGQVLRLALQYHGQTYTYDRISATPPRAPELLKPPVVVRLDTNQLDACVGRFEVASNATFPTGMKLTVWCEGGQLFVRARGAGKNFLPGAFPLFPVSETNFFDRFTGAEFGFIKSDQGRVTALTHHPTGTTMMWFPGWEAKKVSEAALKR